VIALDEDLRAAADAHELVAEILVAGFGVGGAEGEDGEDDDEGKDEVARDRG
jgi:hypothetical protein